MFHMYGERVDILTSSLSLTSLGDVVRAVAEPKLAQPLSPTRGLGKIPKDELPDNVPRGPRKDKDNQHTTNLTVDMADYERRDRRRDDRGGGNRRPYNNNHNNNNNRKRRRDDRGTFAYARMDATCSYLHNC